MTRALLDVVRRYAQAHADPLGVARTPVPGLAAIRATSPSEIQYAIQKPLVALVLQGAKHVTAGGCALDFGPGQSLIVTADVPTVSRIVQASVAEPYLSLVLDLDPAVIAGLAVEIQAVAASAGGPVRAEPTDAEVADTGLRLMQLLDRPASLPVLQASLLREMHYWLLAGRHGAAIRRLGLPDGHVARVARAVAVLRAEFAQAVPVERLAAVAGMSPSSFHHHFRAMTSLSPLQFQKRLRLIEARRLMRAQGMAASRAAFEVGYESVPQFTREFGRLFGLPPVRDARTARGLLDAAA